MTPTAPPPTDWLVRRPAELTPRAVPTPEGVLEGLRDGEWDPSDEVRGPGERMWVPIEEHPVFADAVAGMGPPPAEAADETHLDMNPLIDVALVLLIFFILTATVTALSHTIDIPPPNAEEAAAKAPRQEDLKDRTFTLTVTLDEREQPVVRASTSAGVERVLDFDQLEKELTEVVKTTGRNEMILKMHPDVLWETSVRIHSAATKADVRGIYIPEKKK